jgi:hypothetical protein
MPIHYNPVKNTPKTLTNNTTNTFAQNENKHLHKMKINQVCTIYTNPQLMQFKTITR